MRSAAVQSFCEKGQALNPRSERKHANDKTSATSLRLMLPFVGALMAVAAILLFINRAPERDVEEERAVRSHVARFGSRLKSVGLQDPGRQDEIRAAFGELVTPSLMASWLSNPSRLPARTTSSPWPERLEIREVRRIAEGRYEVTGDVIWVTSVELAEGGAADRERVVLTVERRQIDGWRISALHRSPRALHSPRRARRALLITLSSSA